MKASKRIPAGFLATAMAMSGAIVATAQTTPEPGSSAQATEPAKAGYHRAKHRGEGHHRGRERRGAGEMIRMMFDLVDADGDGAVTQDEVDAFRVEKLAEADTDGDGALSIAEFDTLYREFTRFRMVDMFQDLDADGDGVIGAAEMDKRAGRLVDRMDRDGDGMLTLKRRGGSRD